MRREDAGEHPHRAARVARVERGGRRLQAADLEAKDIELDAGVAGALTCSMGTPSARRQFSVDAQSAPVE